jgi:TATA-box binding protein (TBP) (component of TFIID and TFIIIB)
MKQQYDIGALMQHHPDRPHNDDGESGILARYDGYRAYVYYFKSGRMVCFNRYALPWYFISL